MKTLNMGWVGRIKIYSFVTVFTEMSVQRELKKGGTLVPLTPR